MGDDFTNTNKWEKVLKPIDKNKKFWFICVVISTIVLLAAVIGDTWNSQGGDIRWIWLSYVCDTVNALSTAVLGTFLLNIIYSYSEANKINEISKVSYETLLPDLLQALERFKGRYRKNESIIITLHKYPEEKKKDFFKLILEYQYLTNILDLRQLKFSFYRIKDHNITDFTGGLKDDHIVCDFIWGVDERGFEKDVISDDDYSVSQLIIGENQVDIEKYRNIVHLDNLQSNDNIITYNVPVKDLRNVNTNLPIQLSYRVVLPLQKEDFLLVTHELPTENAKISFNYAQVDDEVTIYGMPITGTIEPLEPSEDDNCNITYVISGWVLPKQGYVFGWWKK